MAAVVSGSGLGLFNSSLAQIGHSHGGQAGVGQALEGQYVNVATGNLVLQDQDESILTRGLPISFVRTYNSLGTTGGVGQDGWLHGFERRVTGLTGTVSTTGSTVRRVLGDGTETVFTWDTAANAYVSTEGSGAHDTLTWNATNSRWTWTEGSSLQREVYDASGTNGGRLMSIVDVKSGATYNLAYTSGRLTSVVSSLSNGDGLYFTYDASNRLQSINTRESGTSRGQVWFEYDGFGRLQSVLTDLAPDTVGTTTTLSPKTGSNDGAGNLDGRLFRTTYAYVSASASDLRIASITQSDGTVVSYGYVGSTGQIATVTRGDTNANDADGLGETLTFTYRAGETDVTDGQGRVTTYVWEAAAGNRLREVRFPADGQGVRDVAIYSYGDSVDPALVTTVETRRGATVVSRQEYAYDAHGNLTRQWSVLDAATGRSQRIDRTYSTTNQLLTETTYTEFDPDGRGGQDPASASGRTVRYLYDSTTGTASTTTNGNKVRFVIDAEGRVTEYLYQTSGGGNGLVRSIRRFEDRYTSTTFTTSALNTWATNSARNSRSTRTDFIYDAMGRLSEQRDFASVSGTGVGVLDAATQITRFTYDAQGLLRQSIVVRGSRDLAGTAADGTSELTSYAYDGMGRLVGTVRRSATAGTGDAETVSTTVAYLDGTRTIVTTMDSGAVQTEVRNAAGRVVSSTLQSAAGVTAGQRESAFVYDAAGQLRASRDASGAARYFFYDEDGRLATEVDATGAVVSYAYNANGQLTSTTAYANRVALPAWPTSRDVLPTAFVIQPDAARDRVSTREYDLAGRLTAEVDGEGVRVEIRYDAAGRVERRIATGGAGTADDRVTRYFYDKADRQTAVLDAEGFVTEFTYDGVGRMIRTTSYATAVAPANREAATIAALAVATDPAKDRVTRHYYNGRDLKVGELDAEGYLTVWTFDDQGNSRGERRYANRAVGVTNADTLAQALAKIASPTYTETRQGYNAQGQLVWSSDIHGTTTTFHYDEAGRLVRTTRASGSTIEDGGERDNVVRLNSFGEVIGEISGESLQRAIAAGHIGSAAALEGASEATKNTVFGNYGTTHAYDALGRKAETRDASGAVVWFFYDAAGRLTHTLTGLAGNSQVEIVQTRYNAFGQIIGTTSYSARGQLSTANSRESAQAIVDSLNAQGGSTVAWRDAWGNVLGNAEAQATSAQASIEYDRAGRQTLLTRAIGGVLASETRTRTTYTAFGQVDTQTVADGTSLARSTTFGYDRRGIVSSTSESGGGLTRTTGVKTDAFGNAYEWTDARGVITTATHDRLGRQLTLIRPMDASTGGATTGTSTTTYDAWGRVLTHTDASNRTTTTTYDDSTRTITVSTGDGVTTTTTVNRHGETVSVKLLGGVRIHHDITSSVEDQETVFEYDRSGRLVKTTRVGLDDQAGAQSAQNGYDVRGLLVWSTDADGRRTIYRYDAAGRQLEIILDPSAADAAAFGITDLTGYAAEPLRISSQIRVDGQGRTVEMTDGAGIVTRYEYDRAGQQTRVIVDPAGLKLQTVIERDALGQTVVVREGDATNPNLKVSRYEYDGRGRRTAERVDPDGLNLTTTYRYDANDNLVARVDANGHTTRYVYDADNRLRFVVDPLNGVEETRYDAAGRKIESRRYTEAATLSAAELTDLEANTHGAARTLLASRVSGLAAITETYAYDQAGQLESVTDGLGHAERYVHDAHGRRAQRIDRVGQTWSYAYDAAGRLTSETDPLLNTTTYLLDGAGNITRRTDATSRAWTYRYDAAGRLQAEVDPLGKEETYQYDGAGRRTHRTDRNGATWEWRYDAAGRVEREIDALEQAEIYKYDARGNRIERIDRNGKSWKQEFDAAGRMYKDIDALGHAETFEFDGAGQITARIDRNGARWEMDYDAAGQLEETRSPEIAVATLAADGAVQLTPRAIRTRMVYDAAGQLESQIEDFEGSAQRATSYGYDAAGRRTSTTYPAAGALTEAGVFDPEAGSPITVVSRLDAAGREAAIRGPNGAWSYRYFDDAGRLHVTLDAEGYVTQMTYDDAGRETHTTRYARQFTDALFQDAVESPSQAAVEAWLVAQTDTENDRSVETQYDLAGRKTLVLGSAIDAMAISGTGGAASVQPSMAFHYDAVGNVRQQVERIDAETYAVTTFFYDALGRRTQEVDARGYVTRYSFQNTGETTSKTEYSTPIDDWSAVAGSPAAQPPSPPVEDRLLLGRNRVWTWGYDAAGRMTSETSGAGAQTVHGYDDVGRRTSSTLIGFGSSGEDATTTTVYDAAGRAIATIEPARSVLVRDAMAQLKANPALTLDSPGLYRSVSPLTLFAHDALGNAIASRQSAQGFSGGMLPDWSSVPLDSEDRTTVFVRDLQGRVVMERRTDIASSETRMWYDANDRLVRSVKPLVDGFDRAYEIVHEYEYNARGEQIRTTVDGQSEFATYTAFGEVASRRFGNAPDELVYRYDHSGNLAEIGYRANGSASVDASIRYGYSANGVQLQEARNVDGTQWATTRRLVDVGGQVTGIRRPSSAIGYPYVESTVTQDRWGNVVLQSEGGVLSEARFDANNQIILRRQGAAEHYVPGRLTEGALRFQGEERWTRDAWGRELSYRDANNLVTETDRATRTTRYDTTGQQLSGTDAVGVEERFAYTIFGERAFSQVRDWVVDAVSASSTAPPRQEALISYSLSGKQGVVETGWLQAVGSGGPRLQIAEQRFELDGQGNRRVIMHSDGSIDRYRYGAEGRVVSSRVDGVGKTITYDTRGNKLSEFDGTDGQVWGVAGITWTWDALNRLVLSTDSSEARTTHDYLNGAAMSRSQSVHRGVESLGQKTFAYHASGELQAVSELSVIGAGVVTSNTAYVYDWAGRRIAETTRVAQGGPVFVTHGSAVDPRQSRDLETVTRTEYDNLGRALRITQDQREGTSAGTFGLSRRVFEATYAYDANGNRIRASSTSALRAEDGVIAATNRAPLVAHAIPDQVVPIGETFVFQVPAGTFRDPDGDALELRLLAPSGFDWVTFDAATSTIRANLPSHVRGPVQFTIAAREKNTTLGLEVATSFLLRTGKPPIANYQIGDQLITVGREWSLDLPADLFRDPDGDFFVYWPEGLPPGVYWEQDEDRLVGVPEVEGEYTAIVVAKDSAGIASRPLSFTIKTTIAEDAPKPPSVGDQLLVVGEPVNLSLPAFVDDQPLTLWIDNLPLGLSFDPLTRTISGTPIVESDDVIRYRATDGTTTSWSRFRMVIEDRPRAPDVPAITVKVGREFSINLASFTDSDVLTHRMEGLPPGVAFDPATRRLSGLLTAEGSFTLTYIASDGRLDGTRSITLQALINPPPVAPTISLPVLEIDKAVSVVLPPFSDDDALTYSTSPLPEGLFFDPTTRLLHGTPSVRWLGTVAYMASDGTNPVVSTPLSIRVNDRPRLGAGLQLPAVRHGSNWTYAIPANAFVDVDGARVVGLVHIDGPEPEGAHGAVIPGVTLFEAQQTISGGYFGAGLAIGSHTLQVVVEDAYGATLDEPYYIALTIVPWDSTPPEPVRTIPPHTAYLGHPYQWPIPTDSFVDADGDVWTLEVAGLPPGLSYDQDKDRIDGNPTAIGVFNVSIVARTPRGEVSEPITFALTIEENANAPVFNVDLASQVMATNEPGAIVLPGATSPGAVVYRIFGLPAGIQFDPATRTVMGAPNSQGSHAIRLLARPEGSAEGVNETALNLLLVFNDRPQPPVVDLPSATLGLPYYFQLPPFTDSDSWMANWVDGLPSGLGFNAAENAIVGTPTAIGAFDVTYRAWDRSLWGETTLALRVDGNLPPRGSAYAPIVGIVGQSLQFALPSFVDEEPLTYTLVRGLDDFSYNSQTRVFTGTPGRSGVFTIEYTVSDGFHPPIPVTIAVTIVPASPPVANHAFPPVSMMVGELFNVSVPGELFRDGDNNLFSFTRIENIPPGPRYDPDDGLILGRPAVSGTYEVTFVYVDAIGREARTSFTATIAPNPGPQPPLFTMPSAVVGEYFEYTLPPFVDSDPIQYELAGLPSGLTFDRNYRIVSGTVNARFNGSLEYTATDPYNPAVAISLPFVVNERPALSAGIPAQSGRVGAAWTYTIPANAFFDPDGDSVTSVTRLSVNGQAAPNSSLASLGLAFDVGNQRVTGAPNAAGVHVLRLTVADGRGLTKTFEMTLNVAANGLPQIPTPIVMPHGVEGNAYSFTFPAATDDDALTYTLTGLPSGMAFNAATRTLSGTPSGGRWTGNLRYTVTDGVNAPVAVDVAWFVNDKPSEWDGIPLTVALQGEPFTLQIPANAFIDPDGDSVTDVYIGKVNNGAWGRTELSAYGLGFSVSQQRFTGAPSAAGDYWVVLKVEDGYGAFNHFDFLLRVTEPYNPPPSPPAAFTPPMAIVGEPYSYQFPAYTDTDAITYWITDVSGGGTPPGLSFNATTRTLSGTPTGRWSGNIRYMAQNGVNAPASMLVPITVNERPTVSAGIPMQTANQGQAWSYSIPSNAFYDPDGDSVVDAFTQTWNGSQWVRGSIGAYGLSFNSGAQQLSGTPNFSGDLTIYLEVRDGRGTSSVQSMLLRVAAPANQAPYAVASIPNQVVQQGSGLWVVVPEPLFFDPENGYLDFDLITGLPPGARYEPDDRSIGGLMGTIGEYTVTLRGRDSAGVAAYLSFNISVIAPAGGGGGGGGGGGVIELQSSFRSFSMASAMIATPEDEPVTAMASIEPEDPPGGDGGGSMPSVTTAPATDEWFSYDAANRLLVSKGKLVGNAVMLDAARRESTLRSYTARGLVATEASVDWRRDALGKPLGLEPNRPLETTLVSHRYDARGRLVESWSSREGTPSVRTLHNAYFADDEGNGSRGRLKEQMQYFGPETVFRDNRDLLLGISRPLDGLASEGRVHSYDAEGRTVSVTTRGRGALVFPQRNPNEPEPEFPSFPEGPTPDEIVDGWLETGLVNLSTTTYQYDLHAQMRVQGVMSTQLNSAGLLTGYQFEHHARAWGDESTAPLSTQTFTVDYVGTAQGWQEGEVRGTATPATYLATKTTSRYDAWGRRVELEQETNIKGDKNDRYTLSLYRYNGDGQVVSKRDFWTEREDNFYGTNGDRVVKWWQGRVTEPHEAKPNTRFVYSGGQLIAELTEAQAARDGQEAIAGTRYVAGTDGYAAGGGSVVAQAGDTLLSVSQRVYGTSAYWYLLASANGYQYPEVTLAEGQRLQVPEVAVSRNDAGTFKPYNANEALGPTTPVLPYIPPSDKGCGVVGQLIMVVVAVIVTVYTAGAASGLAASAGGGFGATMGAGMSVLGGTSGLGFGAAFAAGAAGGAAGSIASQAVGMATGNVQSFSWRGVATSALTAGVGAGIGAAAQAGKLTTFLKETSWARGAVSGLGSGIVGAAMNDGFSWRQIAANVVGSAIGSSIGGAVGGALGKGITSNAGQFAADFAGKLVGGMVSQAVSSGLMGNSRIDPVNAVGDALGSALAGRWSGNHARAAGQEYMKQFAPRLGDGGRIGMGLASQFRQSIASGEPIGDYFGTAQGYGYGTNWLSGQLDESSTLSTAEKLALNDQFPGAYGGGTRDRGAFNLDGGYYSPSEDRIGGTYTQDEYDRLIRNMNAYATRVGDLPVFKQGTPWDVLVQSNIDYHWAHRSNTLGNRSGPNTTLATLMIDGIPAMGMQALDGIETFFADFHAAQADALNTGFGWAPVNALNYATTMVAKEVAGGFTGTGRLLFDQGARNQMVYGVGNLVTRPFDTLGNAWSQWSNLTHEERLAKAGAGFVGLLTGAGAAAKIGPRYHLELGSVEARGFGRNQVGAVATFRVVSEAQLAERLTGLGGDAKYLLPEHQARIPRSSWTVEIKQHLGLEPPISLRNLSPHRHHILELNGQRGVHRALIREGQDILRRYDIDPVRGTENLVWAPNRGHGLAPTQSLVNELRDAAKAQASRDYIVGILLQHGRSAAGRGG